MKLKAYTITELAVGMLLTALVVGVGFSVYTAFTRNVHTFYRGYAEFASYQQLFHVLRADTERAAFLVGTEEGWKTEASGSDATLVEYQVGEAQLVRSVPGLSSDTFRLAVDEWQLWHGEFPVLPGDRADGIRLQFLIDKREYVIHLRKTYTDDAEVNLAAEALYGH